MIEGSLIETPSLPNNREFSNLNIPITHLSDDELIIQKCESVKNDYMTMINDVHNLIDNCEELSNNQKLEYCNSERHFMKQYLKYSLIKINKCFPD